MTRESTDREIRSELALLDRDAILEELDQILASSHFCNSKRYPALLRYIVESTLSGKSDSLKERTLGVEIFGRSADYDTNSDTIVRYTAGEVRKRLLLYYSEEAHQSEVRIFLAPGSYVPDFQPAPNKPGLEHAPSLAVRAPGHEVTIPAIDSELHEPAGAPVLVRPDGSPDATTIVKPSSPHSRMKLGIFFAAVIAAIAFAIAAWSWTHRMTPAEAAQEEFWAPVVTGQQQVLICTGGVVFNQGTYSGTLTANRDVEYPFISLQNAAAIARVSGQLERYGIASQLLPSPSTPLTDLREHSIALIGAYNNQWTMRLLEPFRFHFSPEPVQSIIDSKHPQLRFERDTSQPYSSADDYAIVARYRDAVTDGWVVVVAGIGRNGTEAAADFATSAHYLALLRKRLGGSLANRSVEAVLKVNVIDGKTGAPTILDAYSW